MSAIDLRIDAIARVQDNIISRRQVLEAGGTDEYIANRRAAHRLWGLDGLAAVPLELNVPFGDLPVPEGVLVHRTRRREPPRYLFGLATTSIERTLLELGASCPLIVIEKAAASAFRMGRSTPTKVTRYLEVHAGKGRPG